jgi:hypothetical protein
VTDAGRNLIRDRMRGVSLVDALSHFAVGTSNTAAANGDIALGAEVFRDVYTQVTLGTARSSSAITSGRTMRTEHAARSGPVQCASGPTLYARRVLASAIVKTIDIASTFEWTLNFT